MNRTLSILLSAALLLAACAPPGEGQGLRTEPVEVMRDTATPPPTQTPIPTPTPHPAFVDLQSRLADLGLTLLPDGTIETTADGGRRTVPNLLVSPEGIISLMLKDGTAVTVTPEDMSVDEAGGLKIKGYEWDSEQGGWVEAVKPVKEFPMCSFAEFEQCPIAFEDVQEQGRYVQSTLHEGLFEPEKLKFVSEYEELFGPDGKRLLVPDVDTVPNYPDPATRPFIRDYAAGMTEIEGKPYIVIQAPYYVEGVEPQNWPVMTGLFKLSEKKGNWKVAVDYFLNRMNIVPWRIDQDSIALATQFINPETGENFSESEVRAIIEEMRRGDFSRVNGLVLYFHVAANSGGWYD